MQKQKKCNTSCTEKEPQLLSGSWEIHTFYSIQFQFPSSDVTVKVYASQRFVSVLTHGVCGRKW